MRSPSDPPNSEKSRKPGRPASREDRLKAALKAKLARVPRAGKWPTRSHARKVLLLAGGIGLTPLLSILVFLVVLGVLAYSGDIVLSITGDKIDSSKLALLAERSLDEFKAFKAKLVKCVNGYLLLDESVGEERLLGAMGFPVSTAAPYRHGGTRRSGR